MDTPPDQITAQLLSELMKFETFRIGHTAKHEQLYFQRLLMVRFAQKDFALQHLAEQNSRHVAGWCTFALACLNIESEACRSRETLGQIYSTIIDAALFEIRPGVSHELERVRSFKVQLFRRLKEKGMNREEIEKESPNVRKMLYQGGMLMTAICADYHTRDQIMRNVIETVAGSVVNQLRTEVTSVHGDDAHENSISALVQRIAKAMATSNGDPILDDTQILSKSTGPALTNRVIKESRTVVAVDSKGNRYFSHVRGDGRGQIEIESPEGITTTLKFWPPDSYLRDAKIHPLQGAGDEWRYSADTHRSLSIAGLILIFAFFYQIFPGRGTRGFWPAMGEMLVMTTYFISVGILVRSLFGKMRLHFLIAVIIALLIFVGWFIVYRAMTGDPYSPSLLLAAALYFSFQTLRLHHPETLPER